MQGFSVIPSGPRSAIASLLGLRRSSGGTESHTHVGISNTQTCDPTLRSARATLFPPKQITDYTGRKMLHGKRVNNWKHLQAKLPVQESRRVKTTGTVWSWGAQTSLSIGGKADDRCT